MVPAGLRRSSVGIRRVAEVQVVGQLLQVAVAAADAGGAAGSRCWERISSQVGPAGLPDPGGVGVDLHALGHRVVAGGDQALDALHLHHADAAGADLVDVL